MKPCASRRASSARASPTRSGVGSPVRETSGTWTVCHEHISRAKEVWCCTRDEGRPLEVRSQVPASNPCKLRSSRAIVVSVAAKGGRQSRQVRSGEASESELLMTCRNAKDDVKTGGSSSFPGRFGSEGWHRGQCDSCSRRRAMEAGNVGQRWGERGRSLGGVQRGPGPSAGGRQ